MGEPMVAVLDIGKTNLKLLVADAEGEAAEQISRANVFQLRAPYLAIDVAGILDWLLDALPALAARHDIKAIIPCAHGCTGHLCGADGPLLPMMDYEAETPSAIDAAYAAIAPPHAETMTATGPGANQIAKQLLWQQRDFPEAFARAKMFLTLPQYIAFALCGRAASEISQIAAQNHLWAPLRRDFSSLVDAQGWRHLFPPFAAAGDALGALRPELAARAGLSPATQVLCGVHDSNANLFRYKAAGLADHTVFSTGTWMIGFQRGRDLATLPPGRGMVSNVDVDGEPVASSLSMAGREYAILAGEGDCSDDEALAQVAPMLARGTLALPSFAASDGLFPDSALRGRILGPPPQTAPERRALAALYVAFTAHACLDALESARPVVIDGGFAANRAFARLLAALRPGQQVKVSASKDGTALGAALLWRRRGRSGPVASVALEPVQPFAAPGLPEAAARWRALAGSHARATLA